MSKVLFITTINGNIKSGGKVISERNKLVLRHIFGEDSVETIHVYKEKNTVFSFIERLFYHYVNGLSKSKVKDILSIANNFDYVFLDTSTLGPIAYELKLKGFSGKIFQFFHNVEHLYNQRTKIQQFLYPFFDYQLKCAEKLGANYSDYVLSLNQRDREIIKNFTGRDDIKLFPSSLEDEYEEDDEYQRAVSHKGHLELLFVGVKFPPNENGIKWFIKEVLPHVDATLTIVGRDMDKLSIEKNDNIKVFGYVDSLSDYYKKSDCVIAPIFQGSGMKTKTAEALMWGKIVIGTDEAFCGYELNKSSYFLCNTKDDFIKTFNNLSVLGIRPYNVDSRNDFLKRYSIKSSIQIMTGMI